MRDIARLDDYRTDQTPREEDRRRVDPSRSDSAGPETPPTRPAPPAQDPLWREALGERLRAHRLEQRSTLTRTAERAGLSPQYLSEIERGLKEPSSEMIAAVAGALGFSLPDLVGEVARHLAASSPGRGATAPQLLAAA
jgi:DNA-binding XRE family transcriptional regulator